MLNSRNDLETNIHLSFRNFGLWAVKRHLLLTPLIAHEENWIHRTIKVLTATPVGGVAGGAPAVGVDTNIVLDPADHDTLGKSYPRVGDVITIPGTNVQGRIITKTTTDPAAHIIRVSPNRSTDTLGAIAAGTTLAITSGSFGGGTGQPNRHDSWNYQTHLPRSDFQRIYWI